MIYSKRCYKNFDKLHFRAGLINGNCDSFCHDPNPNAALGHFLKILEKPLDKHVPYKNIKHPKSEFETKPWITPGLANSVKIKNKLYKSFCKEKDHTKKKIMKDNSKYTIILYLHYLGTQKNHIINNTLEAKKSNLKLVCHTIKGIISMKTNQINLFPVPENNDNFSFFSGIRGHRRLKGCACYIFESLFYISKREQL